MQPYTDEPQIVRFGCAIASLIVCIEARIRQPWGCVCGYLDLEWASTTYPPVKLLALGKTRPEVK